MTNNTFEFISQLRQLNINLETDGKNLRYHAPEGALTPNLRQEIIQRKIEIISLLQKARQLKAVEALSIVPIARDGKLPLSFAQQRLWFLHQLSPDSQSYNMLQALRLEGLLNLAALEQSLNELIDRHEIFRTTFPAVDGIPIQLISPPTAFTLPIYHLQGFSKQEQTAQIQQIATSLASKPFDLAVEPAVQFTLLQLSQEEYVLLLKMHHIIYDGWSLSVFFRELSQVYEAFSQGLPSPLAELPIQYADFAVWQRQWLTGEVKERQLNYWQQQLAGVPLVLELPSDRSRPPIQSFQGGVRSLHIDRNLTQRLKQLSKESEATLFMTLLAAFLVLISRYSGQLDILVGTPIANRNIPAIEQLIGFFTNTLALRGDLSGNPCFQDFLAQVRQTTLSAYAHQDLPFEMLVEKLQPERDLSRNPLLQVMFALQNTPSGESSLSGLKIQNLPLSTDVKVRFDLEADFREVPEGLEGIWCYSTDLFDGSTIERMTGHFQTLLEAIVGTPQTPISQLPILTATEQQQLLVEWNDTLTDYPRDKCIHQLFEAQVEKTPDAVAVVFEEQQLTYRQLNSRANQLAHYLRSLGVGADVLVGICVERSLEMIMGLLGILKAGGAYVPLDPEYPQDRLQFMLADAQVSVILTQQRLVERLNVTQEKLICLDTDWQVIQQWSQDNPITDVQPNNLAYVIYTSGSTGQPKGVMLCHANLCNHMVWMQATFPLTEKDKVLQKTPFGFDASVWEFYAPLLVGGQLVMAQPFGHTDPAYLLRLIAQQQINRVQFVPSLLQMLLEHGGIENCQSLKDIFCGGEVLPVALQERLLRQLDVNLHNLYGPTEACIDATFWSCKPEMDGQVVPLGRPIANTEIYILDQYLQPVPLGVPGELHIGGVGLARGYHYRPELTHEKFIPHPFNNEPLSRLYKTGDLARYLPDGNIEYLGRIDNQVKIRGFRIELGEIEAALQQHPQIQTSVVIAPVDSSREKRLVAYLVSDSQVTPTTNQLREYLKTKLPEYMVPSAFVFLETLPLTPNGKVDRRALSTLLFDNAQTENYVAPRSPIEEILTHLFSQILKLNSVGINDNFFELGGHSLLATQLISRIRTNLQVELPLRSLFSAPTVAELASLIQAIKQQNLQLNFPPIIKRDNNSDLPLSYAQTRLWFIDQFQPNSALYNIPLALRIAGRLQIATLEQSLTEIVQRHEALRTNFITIDGQPNQIIHPQINRFLSLVDLQHLETTEQEIAVQELVQQQTNQPFDLANNSLIRTTLINKSETEHILIICLHHIISDGWSMGVFIQELAALYNADTQGQPSPLTPLPIQYPDFAIWQREWLSGEILKTQLTYWKQQLADAPALLSLPTDRKRPAVQTYIGAHQKFGLSVELTQKLTQLSQEQGTTLFMTLLAGFKTLLYCYTGQSDIVVGTPIANRNHSEIESLIGFFVNTLVLRTDLAENPSFTELLRRVKEVFLAAYTHQDLPFEMLVEALQPERDLSYSPLFQVMFVLQNAPLSELELSGLTLSPQGLEMPISKFDLTLSMENTAAGLMGVWEYNTDLFDGSTIERMTGHLHTLLEAIVAAPQTAISQLPILTATEQQQLLVEWNDTQTDYPVDKCLHQLFEEQVEKTPDAIAVVFEEQQLTYRQLNSRANQLAHYLRSLGVDADVLVGICVERSIDMIVGLLGILKAGGAYVPLDPEYPTERLQFMLDDAQVSTLLTQQRLVERLNVTQENLICLDTDWQVIQQWSQSNLTCKLAPSNLAYVIYTSGSTGQPKGAMNTHKGICNRLIWMQEAYQLTTDDVVLQKTPFSFDVSVWEFFWTLCNGSRLVIAQPEGHRDREYLVNLIAQQQVTTLHFVPSMLQIFLESENLELCQSLRRVICSGEALSLDLQAKCFERLGCFLHNLYGPTEAAIDVTFWQCQKDSQLTTIPLGRPIANTEIYILDSYLQPVPIGVPGELHIGGVGLARGYLNRPELTTEKFIPHPFSNQLSSRLYKTGDLARYLPDGNIEYLGRIDNQVKIRGFRIELGEIEAVLNQHPQIQTSVVIATVDNSREKRLVAYLFSDSEITPTTTELRKYLKAKLPEYMIPSAFVFLETLPLTPNGKVDRRALPTPSGYSSSETYVSPRNPLELKLAQIWSNILKLDYVGVKDNFFDLGGHSLLAPYVVAHIKQQFNKDLPLVTLFQNPTIEQLALLVQQDVATSGYSPIVAIKPTGSLPPLFCVPGAGGNPFYLYNLARCLPSNQPFYSFQADHYTQKLAPITSIEERAALFVQAMQAVQPEGPYFLAGHSLGGKVAYEMAQQLVRQGQEVARVAILDTTAPVPIHNFGEEIDDWNDAQWLINYVEVMTTVFGSDLELNVPLVLSLAPTDRVQYVLESLKMANILPNDAQPSYLSQLLQNFRADHQVEYVPQEVLPVPITLFRAQEVERTESEISQSEILLDSAWGWNTFSSQPVDVQFVPGNHITMMTLPHVQVLAERLYSCLNQAIVTTQNGESTSGD